MRAGISEYEYQKQDDGTVRIIKYCGEDSIAEVPETVEGCDVSELDAYAFSGCGTLEEIRLPKTILKIGRYAFYQCSELRKLTFYSNIADVGAGAFTGCRKIRELEITVFPEGKSCLREFLSDIRFEVLVTQHESFGEAKFLFPEFFEEAVENTPARIIVTDTHGLGIQYRNCLRNTRIDVSEYDRLFPLAKANESEDFMIRMSLARMEYPERMQEDARDRYEEYVHEHFASAAGNVLNESGTKRLGWFTEHFVQTAEEMKILLELAGEKGNPEKNSFLMDYQHRHFPVKRRKYEL
jgi:hypothetical protein